MHVDSHDIIAEVVSLENRNKWDEATGQVKSWQWLSKQKSNYFVFRER